MKLSMEELEHVAHLARLQLDESVAEPMAESLSNILTYMESLNTLDTDGVEPTVHAIELYNVGREDMNAVSLDRESALQNPPERDGEYFKVPKLV